MNFYIEDLVLWMKDGTKRSLHFQNDKINVITGNSKTGKTAILEIVDYCLCGSADSVVISREHIGENVTWYGLRFHINDKTYTIARGEIKENGSFSDDYYFSQSGEIPDAPCVKMGEKEIKAILEPEFSINDEITIAYGGKSTRKNSKLSFRYFLMFNTLSKDIIDNGKVFFDKMNIERYKEVWSTVFDLALGVIDVDSVKKQNRLSDLQFELTQLEAEKKRFDRNVSSRKSQLESIIKHAKEAGLIEESLDYDTALADLEKIIEDGLQPIYNDFSTQQKYEELLTKRENIAIQLSKLKRFQKSYKEYRQNLALEKDSLLPVEYITAKFTDRTSGEYRAFLNSLAAELGKIKCAINETMPFEHDVDRKLKKLKEDLKTIDDQLSRTANVPYRSIPAAEKLVSLGEIRSDYKHIDPMPQDTDLDDQINNKKADISEIEENLSTVSDRRNIKISALNEYIQPYIVLAKDALDEYGDYIAWFEYRKAAMALRKNKTATTAMLSSSSDHLYLHLCLFAGLHHFLLSQGSCYVPSFLIMDQPSRPYFNSAGEYDYSESETVLAKKDDWSKVQNIFTLWDNFFSLIISQKKHFQIILLEHVSEDAWNKCSNVHLVAIFDGIKNALIPEKHNDKKS